MPEEQPRADSFSTTSPDSAAVPSLYPGPPLLYSCNRHVISLIRLYVVLRGMRAYKARNATSQKRNTHRFWASGFFFFFQWHKLGARAEPGAGYFSKLESSRVYNQK